MENASKALIIAGAIILAVLIIGMGMLVFTQTSNVDSTSQLSEYETTQFNNKFLNLGGPTVKGSRVMTLCETVRSHNMQNSEDISRLVWIETGDNDIADDDTYNGNAGTYGDDSTAYISQASTVKKGIQSGRTYSVTFQYDKYSNLICKINVKLLAAK